MEKLKHCPFCGGFGGISKNIYGTHYCVRCCSCGCSTEYFSYQDEAVEAWNRRAELTDLEFDEKLQKKYDEGFMDGQDYAVSLM